MDELELRILAAETVIIELMPWLDQVHVDAAADSIRAGLEAPISDDERLVRLQALELIEDGRRRFAGPALGAWIRGQQD